MSIKAFQRERIITHDLRRATLVLEKAAGDAGDTFLQYLYGIAVLHLEERAGLRQKRQRASPSYEPDSTVRKLAKELISTT